MVEQFFTIEKVAEMFSVHENTVRKMLKDRELQGIKIGREWRITGSAIDEFARNAVCDYEEEGAARPTGKYAPLTVFLSQSGAKTVSLSFMEIESILGFQLPSSARNHKAWWHEEKNPRGQKLAWSEAGYRVDEYDLENETVTFRVKWNEKAFLQEARIVGGPELERKLKLFVDWAKARNLGLYWGEGKERGTVSPKFSHGNREQTIFCLYTDGKLEAHIKPMEKIAPFDDEENMKKLIGKLNDFDPEAFTGDDLKYPKTDLGRDLDDSDLEKLLETFEWVLDCIRDEKS